MKKKKNQEEFNDYESRIKKVHEVTKKECSEIKHIVMNCSSLTAFSTNPEETRTAEELVDSLERYELALAQQQMTLETINKNNKRLDKQIERVKKVVEESDSALARALDDGIVARLKKAGYFQLFDPQVMKDLEAIAKLEDERKRNKETRQQEQKRADERRRNEQKMMKAMLSNYSLEEQEVLLQSINNSQAE